MGLDAHFTIHVHWTHPMVSRGDQSNPVKDGWPVQEERLLVLDLRKHNRIHAWVCKNVDMRAHMCEDVEISVEQLKALEDALTAFSTDEDALPPCPDEVWGSFFGYRDATSEDQECAVHYAKKIRAMREYIERHKSSGTSLSLPFVGGFYRASW